MIIIDLFPTASFRLFYGDHIYPPLMIDMLTPLELTSLLTGMDNFQIEQLTLSWEHLIFITNFDQLPFTADHHPPGQELAHTLPILPTIFRLEDAQAESPDQRILVRRGNTILIGECVWRLVHLVVEEGQFHLYYRTDSLPTPALARMTIPATMFLLAGTSYDRA
jgi:hypothetical protein